MAHSSSADYAPAQRTLLLTLARGEIARGCGREQSSGGVPHLQAALADPVLAAERNSFVTLMQHGALRGCIGSLSATRPLAQDVAANAINAAFRDPRFAPVTRVELDVIDVQISVLSPQRPFDVRDETELLERLERGIDGLTLEDGAYRSTFLPKVWEQLPDPRAFLQHLKAKAGLPADYWSPTLRFWRYQAENFSESEENAATA